MPSPNNIPIKDYTRIALGLLDRMEVQIILMANFNCIFLLLYYFYIILFIIFHNLCL